MKSFALNPSEYTKILNLIKDFEIKKTKFCEYKTTKIKKVTLNLYDTKKLVLQGKDNNINIILNWLMKEKIIETTKINNSENKELYLPQWKVYWAGDESGVGDFFGPIVVTLILTNPKNKQEFKTLKIRDSKKMNDKNICEIAKKILENNKCIFTKIISNTEFYKKKNNDQNLKEIICEAYIDLIKQANDFQMQENLVKTKDFVIDGFIKNNILNRYINKWNWKYQGNIHLFPKAEDSYIGVAAASVISRFIYLQEIEKIGNKLKTKILLGAGFWSKDQLNKLIEKHGEEEMIKFAKINYKH